MLRTILLANQALNLSSRLSSHQVAHLAPVAQFPVVPLRNRGEFKRQSPAKERAIARRRQRAAKSMTGWKYFSTSYVDFA